MAGERLCSNCGMAGHNKRTCKNPAKAPAIREATPVRVIPAAPQKVEPVIMPIEAREFVGGLPKVDMAPCLLYMNGYTYICSGSFRMEVPNDTTFDQIPNYVSWR
jgi:hypothetical protein